MNRIKEMTKDGEKIISGPEIISFTRLTSLYKCGITIRTNACVGENLYIHRELIVISKKELIYSA